MTTIEDYAETYELVSSMAQNTDMKKLDKVISILTEGSTVLDIGCAEGVFAVTLAKRGHQVTGIDISQSFVQKAKKLAETNNVVDKTNFSVLNIESDVVAGSFDWILCLDLLEHLESPIRALRNIRKSMSPTSNLIITTPNAYALRRLMYCFDFRIPDYRGLDNLSALHLSDWSLKSLARLLNFAGLRIVRSDGRFKDSLFVVCQKCEPIRTDKLVEKMMTGATPPNPLFDDQLGQ